MSDAEIEVETVSYNILPKEVTNEIGTVKLLYGLLPFRTASLSSLLVAVTGTPGRLGELLDELLADRVFLIQQQVELR